MTLRGSDSRPRTMAPNSLGGLDRLPKHKRRGKLCIPYLDFLLVKLSTPPHLIRLLAGILFVFNCEFVSAGATLPMAWIAF